MKKTASILLLWACWGFFLGTLFLLGPVRWVVDYGRSRNWTETQEKVRVLICIGLLAALSFFLARWCWQQLQKSGRTARKALLIGLPVAGALFSVYAFLHPAWINTAREDAVGQGFTIGPYPEKDKLQALQREGYTTVVALLHPLVVPFEPALLEKEKAHAAELGLRLVHIPMLPWVSNNQEAIDSLRQVVRNLRGRCYIHCYLGKDRVNVARRVINQEHGAVTVEGPAMKSRSLDSIPALERGPVFRLEPGVYFTPYPTREEYFGFILAANFQSVACLIDRNDPDAQQRIGEEQAYLQPLQIGFRVFHLDGASTPADADRAVEEIKRMKRPLLIHSFFSNSPEAVLFRSRYAAAPGRKER
ncbi:hypothetical protein V9K67_01295 [Paraflavisolibacter sp. H34]|uniref:hypothetical protein n=1 Tax=Huijunlia imazamoxiresistens TaxID=3127457 RepID=UPI0030175D19